MPIQSLKSHAPSMASDASHPDVDAFVARNREALNQSIKQSRREVAQGLQATRTVDDIIADGRKRRGVG